MITRLCLTLPALGAIALAAAGRAAAAPAAPFEGTYFAGRGDADYLRLLDTCYQMLYPSAELQNIGMLYNPTWNGFVEGPTWGAWWVQNSYGPTYCGLPFFTEPYCTYVANSQDLWFSQMGDGKHASFKGWVGPDGCLCDAAAPGVIIFKQGDGRVDIHDWGMEFTAAGLLLQAEQLLISRDQKAIAHYLPMLRRCADFIETRRDPANNCFLAGPAGNLLAPSYAGYKKPDGTHDRAYLTGLSVTYIAGLDRLIELEKLAGRADEAQQLSRNGASRRASACAPSPPTKATSSSRSTPTVLDTASMAPTSTATSRRSATTTPLPSASWTTRRRGGSMTRSPASPASARMM